MIHQHTTSRHQPNPEILARTLLNIGKVTPDIRAKLNLPTWQSAGSRRAHHQRCALSVEKEHAALYRAYCETKAELRTQAHTADDRYSITDNVIFASLLKAMDAGTAPRYSKVTYYSVVNERNQPLSRELYDAALELVERYMDIAPDGRLQALHTGLIPYMEKSQFGFVHFARFKKIIKEFGEHPFLRQTPEHRAAMAMPHNPEPFAAVPPTITREQHTQGVLKVFYAVKDTMTMEAIRTQRPRRITNHTIFRRMEELMEQGKCPIINKSTMYRLLAERHKADAIRICDAYQRCEAKLIAERKHADAASVYSLLCSRMKIGELPSHSFRAVLKMMSNHNDLAAGEQ